MKGLTMKNRVFFYTFATLLAANLLAFMVLMTAGCATQSKQDQYWGAVSDQVGKMETPPEKAVTMPKLSWETSPDRAGWTKKVLEVVAVDLFTYDAAGDVKRICPKWDSISPPEKVLAIGEFFVALSYFESTSYKKVGDKTVVTEWDPKNESVDVGKPGDKDTWSVGLYQVSAIDSANRKGPKFTYEQLKTPLPNIELAGIIMKKQIANCGKIILPNSSKCRYWAVILDGNKYSKAAQIIARTQAKAPFCK